MNPLIVIASLLIALFIDRVSGTFSVTLPLAAVLFTLVSFNNRSKIAFIIGLVADIFMGTPLGGSALLFLAVVYGQKLHQNRFPLDSWWSIVSWGLVTAVLGHWLWHRPLPGLVLAMEALLALAIWRLLHWWQLVKPLEDIYLRVKI
ncbi:hypothetical protein A3A66_02720 [Microgenomates group bacterium RIFCSPLOWO2_01_FULL_46_13]|nr:MAG: hypothetical protein A2783_03020 [Microgenomates group bacterium RIFCSPHIGHO2_01_FULL_45_11]OGV94882.1 MAG: hypothetical protein A3A66_02720 [Microgenomates group bacterium RIFCSPLOWO2_01_FULL_46_13]